MLSFSKLFTHFASETWELYIHSVFLALLAGVFIIIQMNCHLLDSVTKRNRCGLGRLSTAAVAGNAPTRLSISGGIIAIASVSDGHSKCIVVISALSALYR